VSLSSTEAKYRAVRQAVWEFVWLERLLDDGGTKFIAIHVFCDSQAAVHISKNSVFHERKHIEVVCHFVRDKLQQGLIALYYISTKLRVSRHIHQSLD